MAGVVLSYRWLFSKTKNFMGPRCLGPFQQY